MAKERLSQLQKWILINCYQAPYKGVAVSYIIYEFFKKRTQTNEVVLSNSIWNLIDKGLVRGLSPIPIEGMSFIYGMLGKSKEDFKADYKDVLASPRREKVAMPSIRGLNKVKIIKLTNQGEVKAKELLNIK